MAGQIDELSTLLEDFLGRVRRPRETQSKLTGSRSQLRRATMIWLGSLALSLSLIACGGVNLNPAASAERYARDTLGLRSAATIFCAAGETAACVISYEVPGRDVIVDTVRCDRKGCDPIEVDQTKDGRRRE